MMERWWITRRLKGCPSRWTRQAWSRQAHAWRGMCSPILLSGFWSTLSIRSRWLAGTGAWQAIVVRRQESGWDFIAPYIPSTSGPMKLCFIFSFLWFSWFWMVDGPVWTGPTIMVNNLRAYCSGILSFLDLECAWQSSGCLQRHFQINYPRSSIRVCVTVWNQLPSDRGGVTSIHVRTALVLHTDFAYRADR